MSVYQHKACMPVEIHICVTILKTPMPHYQLS
jgi:hypothetical protein